MVMKKYYPKRINVPLSAEMRGRIERLAEKENVYLTIIVRRALEIGLNEYKPGYIEPAERLEY